MARVRRPGDPAMAPLGGPSNPTLHALLTAEEFRLGAGTERISRHLSRFGGTATLDAAAWIGSVKPPTADIPSVALAEGAGTLGPFSYGFVNNVRGITPFDAPIPELPRKGGLALVVPRREDLPDVIPLALIRGLGVSFIVSVGDGDPAPVVEFLNTDAATRAIAIVLGRGAEGSSLRNVIGAKPAVVLGGDPLCQAVARKVGVGVARGLDDWLARASLLDAELEPGRPITIVVMGGGRAYVEAEAARLELEAEVVAVDERSPDGARARAATATAEGRGVVILSGSPPSAEVAPSTVVCDLRHPGQLPALLEALRSTTAQKELELGRGRVDKELVARVRGDTDGGFADHDAKRLLKAYGVRVTRQAPTNTPTGAMNHARTIGLPVLIVSDHGERRADTLPEARRLAALLLADAESVMVRELYPEAPRARVRITHERGLGAVMRVADCYAILPLGPADAFALAHASGARRAPIERLIADMVARIAACAVAENAVFDLELYVGAAPGVATASGSFR